MNTPSPVDISPKAVELAAVGAENNGQRWLAEMLRELSRSLTACEKQRQEAVSLIQKLSGRTLSPLAQKLATEWLTERNLEIPT